MITVTSTARTWSIHFQGTRRATDEMAVIRMSILLLVALAAVAYAKHNPLADVCEHPALDCPSSYMPGNFLTADLDNPCGYCQCIWGRPIKKNCAQYFGWNDMYKQCIPSMDC
ncbi:uncharacterized protein LOC124160252 [Ischnura elegans]|uniref:uncharacterized protein LOC124160252 n=1 Tax=Ischnura elegans TaxID=197161 RepID=UPI001ED88D20|nr:uncharacterized protein LOC124160252 [Ischnura elegans]